MHMFFINSCLFFSMTIETSDCINLSHHYAERMCHREWLQNNAIDIELKVNE